MGKSEHTSEPRSPSETIGISGTQRAEPGRSYLLVIDGDSSRQLDLPASGRIVIGRADDCQLVLAHKSVSRHHAELKVERGSAVVSDLGSHNGTRVNGAALRGARALFSGDVVSVGDAVLVVHTPPRPHKTLAPVSEVEWLDRTALEMDRALAYGRPLSVIAIDGAAVDLAAARNAMVELLRPIDLVAPADDAQLLLLCPELDSDDAAAVAAEAVAALGDSGHVRAGYATCPEDACGASGLVLAARSAARQAPPGAAWSLSDAAKRIELGDHTLLIADPAMIRQFDLIERLAGAELPILVMGETGVGKEVVALAVHHWSNRSSGPFHAINCAAIPESLVESELFGHDTGAVTGASAARAGLFESLSGGTIFLDEIGELPLPIQAKLLRAVETHKITRVGEVKERSADVRIVAATNRDLTAEVEAGRFRQDLLFRLNVATVILPPLRERQCEIPLLARAFLAATGGDRMTLSAAVSRRLLSHDWPGNVRELKNTMEYVAAAAPGDRVQVADLPEPLGTPESPGKQHVPAPEPTDPTTVPFRKIADEIRELEMTRMMQALEITGGVKTHAAQLVGMPIRTFSEKLKQYALSYPRKP